MSDPVSIKDATDAAVDVAADQVSGYGRVQVVKLLEGGDGAAGALGKALATEASLAALLDATALHDSAAIDGRRGMVMLVRRRDSDAEPTVDDLDFTFLNVDEEGRVKVSSKPASYPDVTGDITAIQPTIGTPVAGGTVIADVSRASNVMMYCTGTFSTVNCTFEGSLEATGENWFGVQAVRSNANTIETATGNLSAAPAYAWELSVNALARVRVRATAWTSGTQVWRIKQGAYATEPIPAAQASATQAVSGTVAIGTSVVPGVAATNLGKAEDAVHASGDTGVAILAVRTDAPATTSSATGDYDMLHTCSSGGLHVSHIANMRNGMTRVRVAAAAGTNATSVKASIGVIWGLRLFNNTATKKFFKLYNKASAPAVGTDVPVETIIIPADGGMVLADIGDEFGLGIAYAITNGIADNDTTAVAANDVHGAILYK